MKGGVEAGSGDMHDRAIKRSERGAEAFARAKRHSRRVRALKVALPVAAVFVSALFIGYSVLPSSIGDGTFDLGTASVEGGSLVMANPTLDGFTRENLPYKMTAARARQAIGTTVGGAIELEEIHATVPIDRDNQATISAEAGTFDRQNDRLRLSTAITLETTSGVVARLQSADLDIASNDLTTDEPVEIEMDGMRIEADTFRASQGGKHLVFENRVRVAIDPAQVRRYQGEGGERTDDE